jgi:hypothetical protein
VIRVPSQSAGGRLIVAFYHGADGPTVRLDAQDEAPLVVLEEVFRRLAAGRETRVRLQDAVPVKTDGCGTIWLERLVDDAPDPLEAGGFPGLWRRLTWALRPEEATLLRAGEDRDGPVFLWRNTPDGWLECAEKTQVLRTSDRSGHQYFAGGDRDAALVVLAHRE